MKKIKTLAQILCASLMISLLLNSIKPAQLEKDNQTIVSTNKHVIYDTGVLAFKMFVSHLRSPIDV